MYDADGIVTGMLPGEWVTVESVGTIADVDLWFQRLASSLPMKASKEPAPAFS